MIKELNYVISERKKIFQQDPLNLERSIARETLTNYVSYRLPESANRDFFIAGRVYRRILKVIFKRPDQKEILNPASNEAILGMIVSKKEGVLENLNYQGIDLPKYYLVKENLFPELTLLEKVKILIRITIYAKWMFLKTMNGKHRQRKALSILQVLETASLLHIVKEQKLTKIYDFTGFHIDSNFIASLLIKFGFEVVKAPSPGPIKTHYKHLICSTICYSNPYQKMELTYYKDTMIFDEMTLWKPQMSQNYLPFYLENNFEDPIDKTIAFYSHGEWLRREMDHSDVGTGTLESEEFILDCLAKYLTTHPEFQLTIYPHPIEKKSDYLERSTAYYKGKMGDVNFKISKAETKTSLTFHQDHIAVIAASTMIYERLLCGFKVLIGSKHSNFIPDSMLTHLEFFEYQEFEEKLDRTFNQTIAEYFNGNHLEGFNYQMRE